MPHRLVHQKNGKKTKFLVYPRPSKFLTPKTIHGANRATVKIWRQLLLLPFCCTQPSGPANDNDDLCRQNFLQQKAIMFVDCSAATATTSEAQSTRTARSQGATASVPWSVLVMLCRSRSISCYSGLTCLRVWWSSFHNRFQIRAEIGFGFTNRFRFHVVNRSKKLQSRRLSTRAQEVNNMDAGRCGNILALSKALTPVLTLTPALILILKLTLTLTFTITLTFILMI